MRECRNFGSSNLELTIKSQLTFGLRLAKNSMELVVLERVVYIAAAAL